MRHRLRVLAVPGLLLVAACGSTSSPAAAHPTPSAGARQALLSSVQKSSSQSFLANMTIDEKVSATGPDAAAFNGLGGKATAVTVQMAAENSQRMKVTLHEALPTGTPIDAESVIYDGAVYVSTDAGATFKALPTTGNLPNQFSADNGLAYLQSVASVTDQGPGTADGVAVERYSAQFDGAKVVAMMRAAFTSLQAPAQLLQVFESMKFTSGSLDVTLDHSGRLVTETGPIDATVDLSALDPRLAGTHLNISETIDAHFHDYGSAVTVTKPAVLSAS